MNSKKTWTLPLFGALAAFLAACATPEPPTVQPPTAAAPPAATPTTIREPQPVTIMDAKNASYTIEGTAYPLLDGVFTEPAAPGSASMTTVVAYDRGIALGDLDADGIEDAAVILFVDRGGSGTFRYLAALMATEVGPVSQDTVLLGDRVRILSFGVQDGSVSIEAITHGPEDPMCCPTERRTWSYRHADGAWIQTGDELVGTIEQDGSTEPPIVTITVKPSKAIIGEKVDIYAHAFDSPGIVRLELWQDDVQTEGAWTSAEAEGVPYLHHTFVYRDAKMGKHEFRVKAIDVDGNEGWSDTKIVEVRADWPAANQDTPEP